MNMTEKMKDLLFMTFKWVKPAFLIMSFSDWEVYGRECLDKNMNPECSNGFKIFAGIRIIRTEDVQPGELSFVY